MSIHSSHSAITPPSLPPVPYDHTLSMDVLTMRTLLEMVQAWKRYIKQVGRGKQVMNVHMARVMGELVERGALDAS